MGKTSDKLTWKYDKATWYPQSITTLESHLAVLIVSRTPFPDDKILPLRRNLAYNLQYTEFLDRLIKDINLSSVLWALNVKSFAVHSAAVIEGIFHYVVVSKGYATTSEWQSCKKFRSNQYEVGGTILLHETEIFIKVAPPITSEMTFDQMAKKVESKKLLGDVGRLYAAISQIRKLRNKIHLYGIEGSSDTDYNNFSASEYELARNVLHGVLTCPLFNASRHKNCFDYLKNA